MKFVPLDKHPGYSVALYDIYASEYLFRDDKSGRTVKVRLPENEDVTQFEIMACARLAVKEFVNG